MIYFNNADIISVPTKKGAKVINDTKLEIRMPKGLKKEFSDACKIMDATQSQVIRHFIRDYIKKAEEVSQSQK